MLKNVITIIIITVAECISDCGIGFLFAPTFHPAAKVVAPIRKILGVVVVVVLLLLLLLLSLF